MTIFLSSPMFHRFDNLWKIYEKSLKLLANLSLQVFFLQCKNLRWWWTMMDFTVKLFKHFQTFTKLLLR